MDPLAWPVREDPPEEGLQHGRPVSHGSGAGDAAAPGSNAIPISGGGGIPVAGGIPVGGPFGAPQEVPGQRAPVSGPPGPPNPFASAPGPVSGPPNPFAGPVSGPPAVVSGPPGPPADPGPVPGPIFGAPPAPGPVPGPPGPGPNAGPPPAPIFGPPPSPAPGPPMPPGPDAGPPAAPIFGAPPAPGPVPGPPGPGPNAGPPPAPIFGPPPSPAPGPPMPPGPDAGPPPAPVFGPPPTPGPVSGPPVSGPPVSAPPGPPEDGGTRPPVMPFGPPTGQLPPQAPPAAPLPGGPAGGPPFGAPGVPAQQPPAGMPGLPPPPPGGMPYGPPQPAMPPGGQPPFAGPPPGYQAPPPGYQPPPGQPPFPGPAGANGPATVVPPLPPMPQDNWHDGSTPTAEEFARRRQAKPADPIASRGVRGALSKGTMGLVALSPGRREMEYRQEVEMVRRNFGGLRQVTVVNPKGGAGKTVAVLLLAMTFGQKRGGYVLAWDNNETQGTLGMRAQQDFHTRTVRDLLHDLQNFQGAQGRIGDLSQYVRAQGEGMFDVLASDESATAGEMLTADAFGEIRDVVSRFYKLIVVDTGNNVRAENWQAAIDATDQLVVTMSARNDSAETASRMLDHLEQHGRQRLVRQAVTVVSMPPSRRHVDVPAITRHFAARTRTVLIVPYERFIDSGEPIQYPGLSAASRDAWLKVAAAVSEGL
ncbi:chromosome partitioning protein [Dactylosporangium salmoneum]|uniref:MinD/ParA family ATP-binding protein n=1 Tax=Dactylosporangium salmoneum TaxID=53361 RepID=UPI003CD0A904